MPFPSVGPTYRRLGVHYVLPEEQTPASPVPLIGNCCHVVPTFGTGQNACGTLLCLTVCYNGSLQGVRDERERERRKRLGAEGELDEDDDGGASEGSEEEEERLGDAGDDDGEGQVGGGLLVSLDEDRAGVAKSAGAMAAQWFRQDLFADPNLLDDDDEEGQAGEAGEGRAAKKARVEAPAGGAKAKGKQQQRGEEEEEDEDEEDAREVSPGGSVGQQCGLGSACACMEENLSRVMSALFVYQA